MRDAVFRPLVSPAAVPKRLSLGFVVGQASKSSSATNRKQVVLHSTSRDPPMVWGNRVIMLRRLRCADLWHDVP
jgi:hypothetical protein